MKLKKIALMATSMALVAALAVGGTLAYLTSTDTVTNTFTVGQVKITLDEAKVGTDGKALTGDSAARVDKNDYKLMPGHVYDKDPTVTVKAGSESSYVRMLVTVTFDGTLDQSWNNTDLDKIFTDYSSKWVRNGSPTIETKSKTVDDATVNYTVITYEYRYVDGENAIVSATTADNKLDPLFKHITIPGTWTNEQLKAIGGFEIKIVAEAIQADGFDNADAAWKAFPATTTDSTGGTETE